jgi:hypothetical protein
LKCPLETLNFIFNSYQNPNSPNTENNKKIVIHQYYLFLNETYIHKYYIGAFIDLPAFFSTFFSELGKLVLKAFYLTCRRPVFSGWKMFTLHGMYTGRASKVRIPHRMFF